ncbi:MAG: amidohydrolase family protein, partial [Chitinophagaceae bacterium]|nr:amidohydrolase family protein [Chitinophagaceae bacterium]
MKRITLLIACLFVALFSFSQRDSSYLLVPSRVFDGENMHNNWQVLVTGNKIIAAGESSTINPPAGTRKIEMPGTTLLPGLIEGHSHLFLHPYNEVSWNDQVLKESRAERTARAVNHAYNTLMAGFTTVRDLGTEGAMYDDAGLKRAIEKGVIPGPRMLVATRAIVATGSYGPRAESADVEYPKGAAEVGGIEELEKEVRTQISKGADVIKIYADYRWGRNNEAMPTFTVEELSRAVAVSESSGRHVVVHSSTKEGMKRSIAAGVRTIEHGDDGDAEIFRMMKEKNIALCPTLAAGESIFSYGGWKKGIDLEPARVTAKKKSFADALRAGVTICMGGDVGVFTHGDNAKEMELMVEYGMKPLDVLRSATSVNADVFDLNRLGRIQAGKLADIIMVSGDPSV